MKMRVWWPGAFACLGLCMVASAYVVRIIQGAFWETIAVDLAAFGWAFILPTIGPLLDSRQTKGGAE